MKNIFKKFCAISSIIFIFSAVFLFGFATPASAESGCCANTQNQTCAENVDENSCTGTTQHYFGGACKDAQGCPQQSSGGGGAAGTQKLPNPLDPGNKGVTVYDILGRVIKAALGLTGAIALVMFIWGGFLWMFSGGNPSAVKKGKDTLVMAVLGLVVIFASYAIVNFVMTSITK